MDSIWSFGIEVVKWFQQWPALAWPAYIFSFLGNEEFYLVLIPLLYWCVRPTAALRITIAVMSSSTLNAAFKLFFMGPRPYWLSSDVHAWAVEPTYGVPSGHSQNAVVLWAGIAYKLHRKWLWPVAIVLIILIGLSRLVLGVHFPHDVLIGWLLGTILLVAGLRLERPMVAWLSRHSLAVQVGVALLASLALVAVNVIVRLALGSAAYPPTWADNALAASGEPIETGTLESVLSGAGVLFGLCAGEAWMRVSGGWSASGTLGQKALRYVIGGLTAGGIWLVLRLVVPNDDSITSLVLRYLRYAVVGLWVSGIAPRIFLALKLAARPT